MKKFVVTLSILVFVSLGFANVSLAENDSNQQTQKVELTDKQKKELGKLHKEIYEKKVNLINKYVEYGVLTKEQAERMQQKMEEHYELLKENGFVMKDYHHKHHSKE